MPLSKIIKDLRRKMASMRSPRTQCCCCAVGVFAAMFGIFMLSAGICIVLNVNYMEVDTSGLPPDLHNEDGKRIVGIILICISICTLGLSATVSIIYFAICNRNPRHATTASNPSSTANQPNGALLQNGTHPPHGNGHHHYSNKHVSKHKGGNGARGTPPGSQVSVNVGSKQRRQVLANSGQSHSQSPSTGTKRGQGRRNMQKVKNHQRLRNRSFALPTHTEEDPEAAKSVVDLKSHKEPSVETSSNSGSSMATSQLGSTITDDYRISHPFSTTSFITQQASPVIIINGSSPNNSSTALDLQHGNESLGSYINSETSDNSHDIQSHHSTAECESDATTFVHENEISKTTVSAAPSIAFSHDVKPGNGKTNQCFVNPIFQNDDGNVQHHETESMTEELSNREPRSSSPTLTNAQTGTTSPNSMIPSRFDLEDEREHTTDHDSVSSTNHTILQVKVKPPQTSDLSQDDSIQTSNSESAKGVDGVSDLPPSSRHHDYYKGQLNANSTRSKNDVEPENRSESRSSFNSAFSTDVDDAEVMQEKLRQLLD